jgi:hypothetical protein
MKQQGARPGIVTALLLLKLASIRPRYETQRLTSTAQCCAIRTLSCDSLLEVKLGSDMPDFPCYRVLYGSSLETQFTYYVFLKTQKTFLLTSGRTACVDTVPS